MVGFFEFIKSFLLFVLRWGAIFFFFLWGKIGKGKRKKASRRCLLCARRRAINAGHALLVSPGDRSTVLSSPELSSSSRNTRQKLLPLLLLLLSFNVLSRPTPTTPVPSRSVFVLIAHCYCSVAGLSALLTLHRLFRRWLRDTRPI